MGKAARLLALFGLALVVFTAPVQAGVETNEFQDLDVIFEVPCANGGAGEFVHVTGTTHILVSSTINGNNVSGAFHANFRGVGVGESTGDLYRLVGAEGERFKGSLRNGQFTETTFGVFNLIGQGRASNLRLHFHSHITINANGEVTADFNIDRIDCR